MNVKGIKYIPFLNLKVPVKYCQRHGNVTYQRPDPLSSVKLILHTKLIIIIIINSTDLGGVGVCPAGLQGVEEPHGDVGHHQEGHHLPPGLGLNLGPIADKPQEDRRHLFDNQA